MENKSFLFIYDTSGIKNYIFGTDKLKEIKGASAILDILNREKSEAIIKQFIPEVNKVYTNGGTGQFILNNTTVVQVEEVSKKISQTYSVKTAQGVMLVCGYAELKPDLSNYQEALAECYFKINRIKNSKFNFAFSGSLLGKNCGTLPGAFAAIVEKNPDSEDLEYVSESSYNKRKALTEHLWNEFIRFAYGDDNNPDAKKPKTFQDIDTDIGLVYADGNAMGKIIKSFTNPDEYRRFAEIVDSSVKEACHSVLRELFPDPKKEIKADILMLGGDDIIVVLSAGYAFDFACKVTRKFNELTIEKLKEKDPGLLDKTGKKGFTISTGVAISKANFPFRILLNQAEELLKSAKKKGSESTSSDYYANSCIDFHVNKQSNQINLLHFRENNYQLKLKNGSTYYRSMRPFHLEMAEKFTSKLKELVNEGNIGRTRIHMMREAINENSFSKIQLKFMHVYGRTKKREKLDILLYAFDCNINTPWNKNNETVILDISDLIDWVGK